MDVEGQLRNELDPLEVRRGSRALHRMAGLIASLGMVVYAVIELYLVLLNAFGTRGPLLAPTATLPLDTALALLGLCATVLIALVAAVWATGQIPDPALFRGRRRVLAALTAATGTGSVVVGTSGALRRPAEGWHLISAVMIFGVGLVLAYISADVGYVIREDRPLDEALQRHDASDRRARLSTARRNWLRRSRSATWVRARNPRRTRVWQTLIVLVLLALSLAAVLATAGGRHVAIGHAGWVWFFDLTAGVLLCQAITHWLAITFITRRWEPFVLCCLIAGGLYLPISVITQLSLVTATSRELPGASGLLRLTLGLTGLLIPPLLCLLGLTVAPRRWRVGRPLTQIRWSVIAAIGSEIERIDSAAAASSSTSKPNPLPLRVKRAVRQATGGEEYRPER